MRLEPVLGRMMLAAVLLCTQAAWAQTPGYQNEQELMAAALGSPTSTWMILRRLIDKCAALHPALHADGLRVLSQWEARHRLYLAENRALYAQLQATTMPEVRRALKVAVETQIPAAVEHQYQAYAHSIDKLPEPQKRITRCGVYVAAIADGKFDLSVTDPALAAYLDKLVAPAPDTAPTPTPTPTP